MSNLNFSLNLSASIDKFVEPARKVNALSSEMSQKLSSLTKELHGIGNHKKSIATVERLSVSLKKNTTELVQAREKSRNLLTQIKSTANPTKKMRSEFDRARNAVERLEHSQKKYRLELAKKIKSLKAAGIDTRKLAEEQKRLGKAYETTGNKINQYSQQQATMERANQVRDQRMQRAANISLVAGGIDRTGRAMTRALSKPFQQAVSFESAMADVRKVVDFDEPDGLLKAQQSHC